MEEENKVVTEETTAETPVVEQKPVTEDKPAKKVSIFIYVGAVVLLLVLVFLLYLGLRPKDNETSPSGNNEDTPKKVVVTSKAVYEFKVPTEDGSDERIILYLRSNGTYRTNNSTYIAPMVGTYTEKDDVISLTPVMSYGLDGCFEKVDTNDERYKIVEYKIVGETLEVGREQKLYVYDKTTITEPADEIEYFSISPEAGKKAGDRTWTACPVETFDK